MVKPRVVQDTPYNGPPKKIVRLDTGDLPPGDPTLPQRAVADPPRNVDFENPQPGRSADSHYQDGAEVQGAATSRSSSQNRDDVANPDESFDLPNDENGTNCLNFLFECHK